MNIQELTLKLIGYEICKQPVGEEVLNKINAETLLPLYNLSKSHDMAHIVGNTLSELGKLGEDGASAKFKKSVFTAVYRYERSEYELSQICEVLEDAEIAHIPLKGSVIREYYPEPWLRTSCDIDILVREENLENAVAALVTKLNYVADKKRNYHDISLTSPSGIHLELHFSIKENVASLDKMLDKVWEYAELCEGKSYRYKLTNEYLYFHVVSHTAYHFLSGGCGIKPFMDLIILRQKLDFNETCKSELLEQSGLKKFAEQAEKLSAIWFEGEAHTDLTRNMQDYILSGGVYGTMQNRVTVQQTKKGGKFRYAMSRIWLPLDNLKILYPVLNKHKWLLPICEVRRWFRLVFCGSLKKSKQEFAINANISQDTAQATKELLSNLGL